MNYVKINDTDSGTKSRAAAYGLQLNCYLNIYIINEQKDKMCMA